MAIPPLLRSALSGLTFGTALLFSGLIRQLFLLTTSTSTHDQQLGYTPLIYLVLLFLTSSLSSTSVIYLTNRSGRVKLSPRTPSEYGWFRYDGNVVGGLLQGVGMAATVSEPGSVFIRLGLGGRVGMGMAGVISGGVVGGLMYVLGSELLRRKKRMVVADGGGRGQGRIGTIYEALDLNVKEGTAVYVLVVSCVITLLTISLKDTGFPVDVYVEPIVGGLLVGVAQAVSTVLTGGTVGVSSVYPNVATHLLRLWGWPTPNPGYGSVVFTLGMVVVGVYVATLGPDRGRPGEVIHRDATADFLGGVAIIFGARMAGGCTSGHGISGSGTLSLSSFVTILFMLAGAILWKLLHP